MLDGERMSIGNGPARWQLGRTNLLLAAISFIALSGCSETAPQQLTLFTTRDSGGVALVGNPSVDRVAKWHLEAGPSAILGGDESDPEHMLFRAFSATRLESGAIAVGNAGTSQVLIFGSDGRRLGAFGRRGRGPGEFAGSVRVLASDQDVLVEDLGRPRKLLRYTNDGILLEETVLPLEATPMRGAWSDPATSPSGIGYILGENLPTQTAAAPVGRGPLYVVRFTYSGLGPDTLREYRGAELLYADVGPRPAFGGGVAEGPRPIAPLFPATTRLAGGGKPWRAIVGDQASAAYDVYQEDGSWVQRVRWQAQGRQPTANDIDLAQRGFVERPGSDPTVARRSLEAMPAPEHTPVYSAISVARDNHVWIQRYPLPTDSAAEWWVFAENGELVASIEMPTGMSILEIGADYVMLRGTDDVDVERIELRSIQRLENL